MAFGSEVHALLESVGWLDEETPNLPDTPAGAAIQTLIESPSIQKQLSREGREIELLREQAIDAMVDGKWISGTIDRMHVQRDAQGAAQLVEIIDFKTDALDEDEQFSSAYRAQLEAYRSCVAKIHPDAQIRCSLISTHLQRSIEI
jgi:ATP-dependent helicase/nuclease subunit A